MADPIAGAIDEVAGALRLVNVTSASGKPDPTPRDSWSKVRDVSGALRVSIAGIDGGGGGGGGGTGMEFQPLTLQNGWVDYDAVNVSAEYAKLNGVVYVRGVIRAGSAAAGTLIATLPVGFRPLRKHIFVTIAEGAVEAIDVHADGRIVLGTNSSSVWLSLNGIHFSDGTTGEEGVNPSAAAWHDGAGAPAGALGEDGDYYLNSTNGDVYAKAAGAWAIVANITGPAGPEGDAGPAGADGQGVPVGGTVGQVLTKNSATDFDTSWQSPSGGGGLHAASHQNAGADEINVAGLSGLLADPQTPAAHTHPQGEVTGLTADLDAINLEIVDLQSDMLAAETAISDHLADPTNAHTAAAIGVVDSLNYFAATEVEAALQELAEEKANSVELSALDGDFQDHINLGNPAAHNATNIFADLGTIENVQAALELLFGISPAGANGDVLTLVAGVPDWQAPAAGSDGEVSLFKSADQSISAAGFVDITGLTFPVAAGKAYMIEAYIIYQSSVTTMGVLIGFNGPLAPTRVSIRSRKEITAVATAGTDKFSEAVISAYNTANPVAVAEIAAAADLLNEFQGVFFNGVNAGTFAFRFSKENVAGTATIKAGSWVRYRLLN